MEKPERKMCKLATRSGRSGGFTLVELAMVVVIIAILSAMAVPRFANSISMHRADAAANRLLIDLRMVRERAAMLSNVQTVVFNPANETYEISGLDDPDHPGSPYVVNLGLDPYRAAIISADFGGDATVRFDMYGIPDSGGTIVVRTGAYARTLTLDATNGLWTISN